MWFVAPESTIQKLFTTLYFTTVESVVGIPLVLSWKGSSKFPKKPRNLPRRVVEFEFAELETPLSPYYRRYATNSFVWEIVLEL